MGFWSGVGIGLFLGANIGIFAASWLAASKRSDDAKTFQPGGYAMDEAVIDDAWPEGRPCTSTARPHSGVAPRTPIDSSTFNN